MGVDKKAIDEVMESRGYNDDATLAHFRELIEAYEAAKAPVSVSLAEYVRTYLSIIFPDMETKKLTLSELQHYDSWNVVQKFLGQIGVPHAE